MQVTHTRHLRLPTNVGLSNIVVSSNRIQAVAKEAGVKCRCSLSDGGSTLTIDLESRDDAQCAKVTAQVEEERERLEDMDEKEKRGNAIASVRILSNHACDQHEMPEALAALDLAIDDISEMDGHCPTCIEIAQAELADFALDRMFRAIEKDEKLCDDIDKKLEELKANIGKSKE